jgi:guanylate kinase
LSKPASKYAHICLSAPSGTGKSTIIRHLLDADRNLALSISATTRAPRYNEKAGEDYIFVNRDEFEKMIEMDQLLEYENVHGEYYGTPRSEVEAFTQQGKCVLFDIDVNGAMSIKRRAPDQTLLIFLLPPYLEELKRRLKGRRTESSQNIQKRLERLPYEIEQGKAFDQQVVNDNLQKTIQKIQTLIYQGESNGD